MVARIILHYYIILQQCGTCSLTKDSTQYVHEALQIFSVLPTYLHSYTPDFITDLPPTQGFNCVLIDINYLTKLMHLIPCPMGKDKLSVAQIAILLFENIFRFLECQKTCS